ncbi:MAG: bacteriocin family protein [Chloroflexi bacterium]|nr:bacteriocin family protein [Chloroflexota bacterium]
MADFLNRNEAPLTPEEWSQLDTIVALAASKRLVARRFINVVGPVGSGMQAIPNFMYEVLGPAHLDMIETYDDTPISATGRVFQPMPVISKDFILHWRDIELSRRLGFPLELGAAGAAAYFVADMEDNLIFWGSDDLKEPGLLNASDIMTVDHSDWGQVGTIFGDAVNAMTQLVGHGFFGPYAMVVSPADFALMSRLYGNTGRLEVEQVRQVMTAGVFFTASVPDGTSIVVSTGPQNLDLVIGQDMTVAYLTQENLDHPFRVMESLALRIHRPGAIVRIGGLPAPEGETRRGRSAAGRSRAQRAEAGA